MAKIPTLKDILNQYTNVAKSKAPVDTGFMRDTLRAVYKKLSGTGYGFGKYQFTLKSDAPYLIWWNEPPKPVSKRRKSLKRNNRRTFNFANKAFADKSVQKLILDYTKGEINLFLAKELKP